LYYAGGGGGGSNYLGYPNVGNGGGGGAGSNGTINTGGGGGANASGGSGVVAISILTTRYTGTISGAPTVTTSGSNTIIKFTQSGSYTA
jgi:hypothetical protein